MKAHNSTINHITTNSSHIFSASNDGSIGMWRVRSTHDKSPDSESSWRTMSTSWHALNEPKLLDWPAVLQTVQELVEKWESIFQRPAFKKLVRKSTFWLIFELNFRLWIYWGKREFLLFPTVWEAVLYWIKRNGLSNVLGPNRVRKGWQTFKCWPSKMTPVPGQLSECWFRLKYRC
jgi:hypothetical protein